VNNSSTGAGNSPVANSRIRTGALSGTTASGTVVQDFELSGASLTAGYFMIRTDGTPSAMTITSIVIESND